MSLVLDAGALLAYEREPRRLQPHLVLARASGEQIVTPAGVVAQVWRGGPRQARIALLLAGVAEVALDPAQARRVGVLIGGAGTADVVDGSVVDLARDGDEILTSDPRDIATLAEAGGRAVLVTPV